MGPHAPILTPYHLFKGIDKMDVFGTVLTAGALILQFLDACSAYSDEAKSLKTRFDWDIRVLRAINDYFAQLLAQQAEKQLAPDDADLLDRTATYLDGFIAKVQKTLWKIERKGWLKDGLQQVMWMARRADLKEMEKEIFEWTKRFDVRVLGLPRHNLLETIFQPALSLNLPQSLLHLGYEPIQVG